MDEHGLLFGERRLKERKTCSRLIEIDDYRSHHQGNLRNLTATGAFFEPYSDLNVSVGQELSLTIPYGNKKSDVTIKARVAWITDQGIGVSFQHADMLWRRA